MAEENYDVVMDINEASNNEGLRIRVGNACAENQYTFTFKHLDAGDFFVANTLIERKTLADFIGSIIDGRIFDQCKRMCEQTPEGAPHPMVVIEGSLGSIRRVSTMHDNSVMGAILSLKEGYGIVPLIIPSIYWTVDVVLMGMIRRFKEEAREFIDLRKPAPKMLSLENNSLNVLIGIPYVSTGRAQILLQHFGSVKNVLNAPFAELMRVPNIGRVTASSVVVTSNFDVNEGAPEVDEQSGI